MYLVRTDQGVSMVLLRWETGVPEENPLVCPFHVPTPTKQTLAVLMRGQNISHWTCQTNGFVGTQSKIFLLCKFVLTITSTF